MSPYRVVLLSASVALCCLEVPVARFTARETAFQDKQIEPEERPLPPGAIGRLGSLRLRHEQEVRSIVFSPDGTKIASVSQYDPTIRVWDTTTGKLLHELNAPGIFSRDIFAPEDYTIAFTPDGKAIAAGVGGDVCFWELPSGREIRRFRGKGKCILALTFSPDNKTFYCGGSDNQIKQWDIATGKQLRSWDYFEGNQPKVYPNGFAEKRAVLKAITPDGKTAVWRVQHRAEMGNRVEVDSWQLKIWNATTGKDRGRLTDKDGKDFFDAEVVFSRDGKYLTAYTHNHEMTVWDAATGQRLKTLGSGASIKAVAYSPNSLRVAAVTSGGGYRLNVWDLATGKELWHHDTSRWYAPGWHQALAFSPDGKTLALAHGNNVRLWDVKSTRETPSLEGHRWAVRTLVFSPKDGTLISADDGSVCQWSTAKHQTSRQPLLAYFGHSRSVAESYETKLRIYHPEGWPPQLRDLITDKILCEFDEVKGGYYRGCFSADGRTVALLDRDQKDKKTEIIFLDIPSRKVLSRLMVAEPVSENLVLSADGKLLAVSCSDQTAVLIDSFKGEVVRRLGTPHPQPGENDPRTTLTTGTFSPDGQLLAFGTRLERPSRGKYLGGLDDRPQDPPGIRVWHVATGRELRQFENCLKNAPHGGIASLRFSPDSKSLAVALYFNPWRPGDLEQAVAPVLEVISGRFRRRFQGHTDHVTSVAFSPDGKILATGSKDSTILLWDMKRAVKPDAGGKASVDERLSLHWKNLAEQDAAHAFDAVLALAEMPRQCVPFLAARVKPVEPASDEQVTKLVADLDDKAFKVREKASAKLAALHEQARPVLKKALNGKVTLELQRRIGVIIDQLDGRTCSPALMRELRSVEVLERIGSKDACRLLELLATGAPEALLTIEARASLARLKAAR